MKRREFLKFTSTAVTTLAVSACQAPSETSPTPVLLAPSPLPARTPSLMPLLPTPSLLPTLMPTARPVPVGMTLPNTETWTMVSQITGQAYRILAGRRGAPTDKPLPVIYITDGNGNFPLLYILHQLLVDDGYVPPALLVGIDYPFDRWDDYKDLRSRDFTPTVLADSSPYRSLFPAGSGGAPAFLQFLRDDLKPLINSKYQTLARDATLAGHSLGGLFALYALFEQPDLFQRYLIGSPSLWYDNGIVLKQLAAYARTHTDLATQVCLCIGGKEDMLAEMQDLADQMGQHYPNLAVSHRVFEGETHLSMIPSFYSFGLRAIQAG